MSLPRILSLPDLPLCIGACPRPTNPAPLPNTYPFELCLNQALGRLELASTSKLEGLLRTAYELGIEMGTPSDETELGEPYVADFLSFIVRTTDTKCRALEIGAGVGYLSRLLLEKGWDVDSIEPGKGYEPHWEKYGVRVVNEFFPSANAKGPYDLIVFYTVLEHIKDTTAFLQAVAAHLAPGGKIVMSVPDCSLEIEAGDPSMLLHEHFQYFTPSSLARTLIHAGFDPSIENASFGRSIYASASLSRFDGKSEVPDNEMSLLWEYAGKVTSLRTRFHRLLIDVSSKGSVGIYCPGRALALLPTSARVRLFDDSSALHGKYYPPFAASIESRDALISNPVDTLLIMSRTFGRKLADALKAHLPRTNILLTDDIVVGI